MNLTSPFGAFRGKKKFKYNTGRPQELFNLIDCLGEGTYGTVWTGTRIQDNQTCAVKIVTIDDDLPEIEQEIAIMRDSDSPYIVKFFGCYEGGDEKIWMAMEHCIGGSLNDLMYVCDITLTVPQIKATTAAMTLGLKYLHKNLVIHRDIKAGNVLLTAEGHVKLADFGVSAKLKKPTDRATTAIGAPFWMAPEVITEEPYDGKADCWSLGITLIELAEGRPPNSHLNAMKALFIIPQQPAPTLTEPNKWPKDMRNFVSVCLQKDPNKRPMSKQLPRHVFINSECKKIEDYQGRSTVMRKLVVDSLGKIEQWRNVAEKEDGTPAQNENYSEPARTHLSMGSEDEMDLSDVQKKISAKSNGEHRQMVLSPQSTQFNEPLNSPFARKSTDLGEPLHRASIVSAVSHVNPARDRRIRESVRVSARNIEPLRDVVEARPTRESVLSDNRGSVSLKQEQKDLSMADVANIMNSDLPASSSQVQAAVMTKEFIILLKSIYRNDPNAFGGKPIKNWTGEDITVAVVNALHKVLETPEDSRFGGKGKPNGAVSGLMGFARSLPEEEYDDAQFDHDQKDLASFMAPLKFDPKRDGAMPPPPPSDDESELEV
eukprot:maker-scaffold_48-snap-gene-1.38-mRNA-1 protein AED:0.02 eAED:0.02 QI:234/1/1/1/1/1/2/119/600